MSAIEFPEPVLQAISAGLSVVPADMDKRPKVRWKDWQTQVQTPADLLGLGHGSIWGVVTGAVYGLTVLDFDKDHGGLETLKALGLDPHVLTPGGAHVYVAHPGHPVKNSARKFPEYPGMDVRGDGGLAWFHGRSRKGAYETVQWPPVPVTLDPELTEKLFPVHEETERAAVGTYEGPGKGTPEAVRYVRRLAEDIESAPPGTSNQELNKAGYGVGGLVAAGQLDEEFAYDTLLQAAISRRAGDPTTVLVAAMASGADAPWVIEPYDEDDDWLPAIAVKLFQQSGVPDVTPFPIEALEPLDDLIRQGAAAISCPPDYVGAALLPALGVAIGGYVDLAIAGTWRESAAVYTTLAGPPGSRKSPAMDLAMEPVWEAETAMERAANQDIEDPAEKWKQVEPPSLVVDDATIEALFGVLERNDRGVILAADELAGWVKGMGQYKGGLGRDRQHWLSIWSRKPIKVDRVKGASRRIRRPFVTVLGGIQPEPLEELLHGKDDGLLPRLLVAQGEFVTPKLRKGMISEQTIARYAEVWNRIRDEGAVGRTVQFTPDGFAAFETWVNEHYKTLGRVPPELAGAWSKMDGQAGRIALILAQLAGTEVTPDVVDRSVALVRYFQGQAVGLFQGTSGASAWEKQNHSRIKFLARYLAEHPHTTKAELMGSGPAWALDARFMDRALETLDAMGLRPRG